MCTKETNNRRRKHSEFYVTNLCLTFECSCKQIYNYSKTVKVYQQTTSSTYLSGRHGIVYLEENNCVFS